jgi:prepilin-type N-terminal cleavage/methylation domain-containing protein
MIAGKGQTGFTLVELLVVIAIVGLIGLFALPSVNNVFKLSLNSTTREMAAIVKEAYNATVMTGRVHRVVYDFKAQAFWVEAGPKTVLLDTLETKEREERRKRFSKDEEPPPSEFALAKSITRKAIPLPRGVEFEDIVTEQSTEPVITGTAYTHFFPHGIAEQTIIHLKDDQKHQITLVITPLIGRTRLIDRYARGDEIYGE